MPNNVINSFMAGRQVRNDQQDRDLAAEDRQRAEHLRNAQRRINMLMAPNGGALGGDQGGNPVAQPQPNAMQSPTSAPQGQMPAAPMAQGAPGQPMSNRAQAEQIGRRNPELMAQFGQMDQAARDRSAAAMTAISRVVNSLRGVPVEQRAGALRAAAPQLFAVGATPEQLSEYEAILSDPTRSDAAIESISSGVLDAQDTFAAFAPQMQGENEVLSRFQGGQPTQGPVNPNAPINQGLDQFEAETARIKANRPTSPLVAINEAGTPDPFARDLLENDAARAQGIRDTAQAAQETMYNLDILSDTLLDPTVYTGAGAQMTLPLRRAGEQLGMEMGNTSASEVANRVSNEMALALKDRLPGPMSDGDRQFLMSIPPNLGNTREGNAALIFMTRRRAQYEQRLAASMDAALGSNPTGDAYRAWEQQQRDIARTDPLYTEDDRRAVQLLLNGAEFRRSGNDIYVIDGDEAIRLGN
jgi:hypothetical protein